ncbi:hypothetical protein E4T50_09105 [Aureobasidium sp. EXF-12298]|nr:hypothetical protein E4T50_09105 [Aureobasidium sp. EXF-12298]
MTSPTTATTTAATTLKATPIPTTASDDAITFCSNLHFHQSIYIPASTSHPKLRVTFSTTTNSNDENLPVVLFCHPMGAARYMIYGFENLAKKVGVRVVIIDRPGFGGSTAVPVEERVSTWLEAVPVVLKYLGVRHVAVVSHSAGTVYAINTVVHLSHLLHPQRPFVGCFAPWVHPTHSSAPLMQVVVKLPTSILGNLHHIQAFVAGYIAPSVSFSAARLGVSEALDEETCQRIFGMSAEMREQVVKLQGLWQRGEDTSAISADATLCMQKQGQDWGVYSSLPKAISVLETTFGTNPSPTSPDPTNQPPPSSTHPRKLTFHVYFSSSDVMIGKGGQQYFESCWKAANTSGEIDFVAKTVPDSDHDSTILAEKGCIEEVFMEVKRVCG